MSDAQALRHIILMAGLPGSGKSTLAQALGRACGWPIVENDAIKSSLMRHALTEAEIERIALDLVFDVATDLAVRQQLSAIMDTGTRFPSVYERAVALAREAEARLLVVRCVVAPTTRLQRLRTRARRPSQQHSARLWGSGSEEETYLFDYLPADTLVLETTAPLAVLVEAVQVRLIPTVWITSRSHG